MPKKKFKIVHIASEVEPFSKTGGLASVASSLPKALNELGHDVCIVTPFYDGVIEEKKIKLENLGKEELEISGGKYPVEYFKSYIGDNVPVFFIYSRKFFGKRTGLYGSRIDNARFFFFNLAALNLLKKIDYRPDIIHCHDWHSGLIPYFLRDRFKSDAFWKNTATVFTIHNLIYQFGHDWWAVPGKLKDDGRSALPDFKDTKRVETINFAKRAILTADAINTVSETYREEILTKDFGEELHRILRNREKRVFGVVNGINYEEYNPETDPGLFKNYNYKNLEKKELNKKWLQKFFKLKVDPKIPVLCMTSRVTEQKGFNLLISIMPTLLKLDLQIIIMGDGEKTMVDSLKKIQKSYPKKLALTTFKQKYETSLYAGSDIFLLPSRFEPCGINQMIALRYGCIPVVHSIGGLADTIENFNPGKLTGNGFSFKEYNLTAFAMAIARALECYKQKEIWKGLVVSGLQEANSWKIPAQKYIDLYRSALKFKKTNDSI